MKLLQLALGFSLPALSWALAINLTANFVSLDYGDFQGKYDSSYNISYFRKIPFAASTAGENRFRAPQPPLKISNGTYDTDQSFDMCPQRTVNGSEDCLYLGVYSRPWQRGAKRPVVVVFYGGAFIQGSATFTIPPPAYPILNVSNSNDFILVYPNYRVNAFGFLPGNAIKKSSTSDLNPGLLDQQYALKWVHKYISYFGGDPHNVTVWGQSAGAGSVVAQVIANGGKTKPSLFSKAFASSPFWPKTYRYNAPEAEAIYTQLVNLTGCSNSTDSLKCLKTVEVQTIREASLVIDSDNTYTTSSYTWAPVVDGEFIQEPLTEAIENGHVNARFAFGTYNTHEGENFVPSALSSSTGNGKYNSSEAGFRKWLSGFLPDFSEAQLDEVESLYPTSGSTETISIYNSTYVRAGLVYRDVVLACPAYWIGQAAKSKGYLGEYAISPARHGSDTIYWNRINSVQRTDRFIYIGYAGAIASFFQTGDPNAHKLTNASIAGVPEVKTGKEFAIMSDLFEDVDITMLIERCQFWKNEGKDIPM